METGDVVRWYDCQCEAVSTIGTLQILELKTKRKRGQRITLKLPVSTLFATIQHGEKLLVKTFYHYGHILPTLVDFTHELYTIVAAVTDESGPTTQGRFDFDLSTIYPTIENAATITTADIPHSNNVLYCVIEIRRVGLNLDEGETTGERDSNDVADWLKNEGEMSVEEAVKKLEEPKKTSNIVEGEMGQQNIRYLEKLPEFTNSLQLLEVLIEKRAKQESFETTHLVSEEVYTKAVVEKPEKVAIWIGANVMVEYELDKAKALLLKNQATVQKMVDELNREMEFTKDQITTTEVNMAHVYNYGVKQRQAQANLMKDVADWLKNEGEMSVEEAVKKLEEPKKTSNIVEGEMGQQNIRYLEKLPEFTNSLQLLEVLIEKRAKQESFETTHLVSEEVYTKAVVEKPEKVAIWIGANVMVEYELDKAKALLLKNQATVQKMVDELNREMEFTKDQITTTEVNMAHVYNYGVKQRQAQANLMVN